MKKLNKKCIRIYLLAFSIFLLFCCVGFLVYYLGIQPYMSRQVTNKYKEIYYSYDEPDESSDSTTISPEKTSTQQKVELDSSYKSGDKNKDGVLSKFLKLIEYNSDIKGWLKIPGTNIDYPVMQAYDGSDFYLKRDFEGKKDKNGSLYIGGNINMKKPSKNIVMHGHNMDTTGMMFHQLLKYKDLSFYQKHPLITFDSIYKEGDWIIFAYMRVSADTTKDGTFNYMQNTFSDKEAFLDFIYQIEMRSLYKCPISINEKDRILMLSTCSYEASDYRTVVVARKFRKGESIKDIDTSLASMRSDILYPSSWYSKYGGKAPEVISFSDAMSFNEIDWYDGNMCYDTSIGKQVKSKDGSTYTITSKTTAEYTKCNNNNLKKLGIPSTITVDKRTFDITSISKDAFTSMKKLEQLKIGNKIEAIANKMFVNCRKLQYVIIGDSVTQIGEKAFYNLNTLKKVKIRSLKLKDIGLKAFKGTSNKVKFKLPKKYYKDYKKLIEQSRLSKTSKAQYIKY